MKEDISVILYQAEEKNHLKTKSIHSSFFLGLLWWNNIFKSFIIQEPQTPVQLVSIKSILSLYTGHDVKTHDGKQDDSLFRCQHCGSQQSVDIALQTLNISIKSLC